MSAKENTRMIMKFLRPYWRLRRGMTLGAQGAVFDGDNRVLLVRHAYRPGWHLPGGGVEWNETVETAALREVFEETGVIARGRPVLHGIFANFKAFPGDHIAVFLIRDWSQPVIPAANGEIAEQGFFARAAMPGDTAQGARSRIDEILSGAAISPLW